MSKLIGIPNEPKGGFAMPLIRGFPCVVEAPMMGAHGGPKNGIGVGWSHVVGVGLRVFVTVHGPAGVTLAAQLDPARYKRFVELLASAGQQAKLIAGTVTPSIVDPLEALSAAHTALKEAEAQFAKYERMHKAKRNQDGERKAKVNREFAAKMQKARRIVADALMLDEGGEEE